MHIHRLHDSHLGGRRQGKSDDPELRGGGLVDLLGSGVLCDYL
jgi:hypothetical protein